MKTTFKDLKEWISEARSLAKQEALSGGFTVVQSRGAWLRAIKDNESLNESEQSMIKSKTSLLEFVEYWVAQGVTQIQVEGGFDGGYSVNDWEDHGYEPWVSGWSITLWTKEDGWVDLESD